MSKPSQPKQRRLQPLYHQVYLDLHHMLTETEVDPNQALPSEPALAAKYGVSRVTVRSTLEQLASEGLIRRIHGKGTYPTTRPDLSGRANLSNVLDNLLSFDDSTHSINIEWEMSSDDSKIAELLESKTYLRIKRQRWRGDEVISFTLLCLPENLVSKVDRHSIGSEPVVRILERQNVQAETTDQTLFARAADEEAAHFLKITPGEPLMVLRRVMYDGEKRPVLYQESSYRADRFEYRMSLSRMSLGPVARWAPRS